MFHRVVIWLSIGLAVGLPACCAGGSTGGESEPVSLNPLSWEWIQQDLALWTAVVFLILLAVLTKFAWRPIINGLDKRERHVADQIAQAETANQKAKDLLAEYDRRLAAAADQVRTIIDHGRRDAEQFGRELVEKAKQDAQAEQQRAVVQIEAAAAAARKDLAGEGARLAVELAGKIVGARIKPDDHARLIEQAVAGFVKRD